MNILIDNKKVNFTESNFPILIHGVEKSGASFFSVCLLANLLKNGFKTLLFSAYPMAKEEFRKQIIGYENKAIIINSGEEQVLIDSLRNVTDLNERVVLIKNIDNYSLNLFNAVKDLKLVIFSGDLNKCEFADDIMKRDFATKILFSQSEKHPQYDLASLPKYHGRIISSIYNGMISLNSER
ncbi:MAG: hypothetical protein MUF50_01925 [Planctomycetes bacterium]|jgi:hypothetical protein|nr:hypothetical protein [Planctomycetota bacterium]